MLIPKLKICRANHPTTNGRRYSTPSEMSNAKL